MSRAARCVGAIRATIGWSMRLLMVLALVTGCVESRGLPFTIEADPGDLVLLGLHQGDDLDVSHFFAGREAPAITVEDGDRVSALTIRRRDLVDRFGEPLAEQRWAGLASRVDDGTGACRAPSPTAPQVVRSGDVCPAPIFATPYEEADGDASLLRAVARLVWPGDDACSEEPTSDEPLRFRPLLPSDIAPHRTAAASGSTLALFGATDVTGFENGQRRTVPSPFEARVFSALGDGDQFFVSAFKGDEAAPETLIYRFDAGLTSVSAQHIGHRTYRFLEVEPGQLLLTGESATGNPMAVTCRVVETELECASLLIDGQKEALGRTIIDATTIGGRMVLLSIDALMVFDRFVRFDEDPNPLGDVKDDGKPHPLEIQVAGGTVRGRAKVLPLPSEENGDLVRFGEVATSSATRVLICADRDAIYGGDIDVLTSSASTPLDLVHPITGRCAGHVRTPAGVQFVFNDGTAALIDFDDTVVSATPLMLTADAPAYQIVDTGGGLVAFDRLGQAYTGTPGALSALYQSDVEPPASGAFLLNTASATLRFAGARVVRRSPGGVMDERPLTGLAGSESVVAGAYDPELDRLLVVVSDGTTTRFMESDVDRFELSERQVDLAILGDAGVRKLGWVRPGRFLLITDDGRILGLEAETLFNVDIQWDDPTTEAVESVVDASGDCAFTGSDADRFRDLAVEGGVGWVVGCKGLMLQVNPHADPAVATRVAVGRASHTAASTSRTTFTKVDPGCGHDVRIFGGSLDRSRLGWGLTLKLAALDECVDPFLTRCLQDDDVAERLLGYNYIDLGHVRSAARDGRGRTAILYEFGVRELNRTVPYQPEGYHLDMVAAPDGPILFIDAAGRWFTSEP